MCGMYVFPGNHRRKFCIVFSTLCFDKLRFLWKKANNRPYSHRDTHMNTISVDDVKLNIPKSIAKLQGTVQPKAKKNNTQFK